MYRSQIKGLNKVLKDLQKFGDEATEDIFIITKSNAKEIELGAKQRAPVDKGFLRNQISTESNKENKDKISFKVVANAPYSAYMEFGTGGEVEVPEELKDIAIKFKGKGIKRINLRPRPFLYPAFIKGRATYIEDLKDLLKKLTDKYSK
jgi:HK97 gp10 family phage protein